MQKTQRRRRRVLGGRDKLDADGRIARSWPKADWRLSAIDMSKRTFTAAERRGSSRTQSGHSGVGLDRQFHLDDHRLEADWTRPWMSGFGCEAPA